MKTHKKNSNDSFYEKLKSSPLCSSLDVIPEESAMWIETNMLGDSAGIKMILDKTVSMSRDIQHDLLSYGFKHVTEDMWASSRILKSVFEALFKACMLDSKPEELKKILRYAMKRMHEYKSKIHRIHKSGVYVIPSCYDQESDRKYEIYAELVERLEDRLKSLESEV